MDDGRAGGHLFVEVDPRVLGEEELQLLLVALARRIHDVLPVLILLGSFPKFL